MVRLLTSTEKISAIHRLSGVPLYVGLP